MSAVLSSFYGEGTVTLCTRLLLVTMRAFFAPNTPRNFGSAASREPGPYSIPFRVSVQAYDPCKVLDSYTVVSRVDMVVWEQGAVRSWDVH